MARKVLLNDGSHGRNRHVADALAAFARDASIELDDPVNDPDHEAAGSCISDLLTGLMHACNDRGISFADTLALASTYYAEDIAEQIAQKSVSYRYVDGQTNGSFTAKLLGTSPAHVVLSVGLEALIVQREDLSRIPTDAQPFPISFERGFGTVYSPATVRDLDAASKPIAVQMTSNGHHAASGYLDELRSWPPHARVSELYDTEDEFATALRGVYGDLFEYPDHSHKSVAQVVKDCEGLVRLAKSAFAAEEIAQSKSAFRHLDTNVDERLEGKVMALTSDHAVVSLGRTAAILPLQALNRIPAPNENVSLKWQHGQAILSPWPNKAVEQGGVGR